MNGRLPLIEVTRRGRSLLLACGLRRGFPAPRRVFRQTAGGSVREAFKSLPDWCESVNNSGFVSKKALPTNYGDECCETRTKTKTSDVREGLCVAPMTK